MLQIIWLLALATSGKPSTGPATRDAPEYDWSTPVAASKSLDRAIDKLDVDAQIGAYDARTDDERTLLDSMRETELAGLTLHNACLDRFGKDRPSQARHLPVAEYRAEIRGDEAFVYLLDDRSGLRHRWVRVAGQWKLPMKDILKVHLAAYKTLAAGLEQRRRWSDGLKEIARTVSAGRYRSAEEVDKAVDDLLDRQTNYDSGKAQR